MAKKINLNEIDEEMIIASFKQSNPATEPISEQPQSQPKETVREEPRKRKSSKPSYESLFIKEANVSARLGKTVYIRKEYHDKILRIVQVIGENELTLFSYLDNILAYHFDEFQDEIIELYNQKNNSIF